MEFLLQLGSHILDSITSIGSFLLETEIDLPLDSFFAAHPSLTAWMPDFLTDFLTGLTSAPLGFVIFGSGLSLFLLFKLYSFIIDLWP